MGGVRSNAEANRTRAAGRINNDNEWIHEESKYCLVLCHLRACGTRSNAEEAASHDERTSQRIRHATQTSSRHAKFRVVVQKFVRTIHAKIRLLAVLKRYDLTEHLDMDMDMLTTDDRAARDFHSQTGLYTR